MSIWRRLVGSAAAALPAIMVFLGVLAIPLSTVSALALSQPQLSSWLFALYAGPGVLGLVLAFLYRQPLVLTGNVFAIILFASVAREFSFSELAGASIVAGLAVASIGIVGLTARISRLVPPQIVLGLLAGAVMPFVVRLFTNVGQDPPVVGGAFVGYLAGRRLLPKVTPLLPGLVVGVAAAALTGQLGPPPQLGLPVLTLNAPSFSVNAIAAITPIVIAITILQANVPSTLFLRLQGYDPPERAIDVVSGAGTIALSFLGPNAVSVPLPIMPLVAGPDCGSTERRFAAAVAAGVALLIIGLFGGVAAGLLAFLPLALVQALAGLALVNVLATSLRQVVAGPLLLGPLFAFVVVQSSLSLLGLGPFFWALVLGVVVSYLLERDRVNARPESEPVRVGHGGSDREMGASEDAARERPEGSSV